MNSFRSRLAKIQRMGGDAAVDASIIPLMRQCCGTDAAICVTCVTFTQPVLEYIIHLISKRNVLSLPALTWVNTQPPTTQSVFELYPDRKEQHAQVIFRLKAVLGVGHIKKPKVSETFELAYVRIRELQRELGCLPAPKGDNGGPQARTTQAAARTTASAATTLPRDRKDSTATAPKRIAHRVQITQPDSARDRRDAGPATRPKHDGAKTFGEILREQEDRIWKSTGLKVVSPSIRDRADVPPAAKGGSVGVLPHEIYVQIARLAIEIREFEKSENLGRN
ncbi:hypothetical protein C8R43DRAFT_965893 [Mycena crocata]|nr:hypothetical protein C8R43DRAFT_965893 [Mycena crocata]